MKRPLNFPALFIAVFLTLTGCATDSVLPTAPEISVTDAEVLEIGLDSQTFRILLDAYNPNKFGLPLTGVEFDLSISGITVGRGISEQSVSLVSQGNTPIAVDVETNLADTLDGFGSQLIGGDLKLDYQLDGKLIIVGESTGIPFTVNGNLLD